MMPSSLLDEIQLLQQKYTALVSAGKTIALQSRARTHLTYHSNALEGNTLTEQQTSLIINDQISIAGKKLIEIQEAINHAKAIDLIMGWKASGKTIQGLGLKELCEIHTMILHDINNEMAGMWRNIPVRIAGSTTILPNYVKVPQLMKQREQDFGNNGKEPVLKAIQAHYDIVTVHPFIDGNGRSARLFMNAVMIIAGYPLINIDISKREHYLSVLENAQTKGNYEMYEQFMLQCIRDSLLMYL